MTTAADLMHLPRYRVVQIRDGSRRGWWRVFRESGDDTLFGVFASSHVVVGEAASLWVAHAIVREDAFTVALERAMRRLGKVKEG